MRRRSLLLLRVGLAVVVTVALIALAWVRRDELPGHEASAHTPPASPTPSAHLSDRATTSAKPGVARVGLNSAPVRHYHQALRRELHKVHAHQRRLAQYSQFTMATFNALGASHTGGHGDRARMAAGSVRAHWVGQILLAHHVDVVSLQEWQASQSAAFNAAYGSTYAVWPGTAGRGWVGQNSIGWLRSRFDLVRTATHEYPYFGGHRHPYPMVLLRDKKSGVEFWVTSQHNPAFPENARWRHVAVAEEVANANAMLREPGHAPLIIAGDMNDHAAFWCPFATGSSMHAANGGSGSGGCSMPAVQPKPYGFDWILGSPGVQFSGYTWDAGSLVRRTTDHPVVITHAKVWRADRIPTN